MSKLTDEEKERKNELAKKRATEWRMIDERKHLDCLGIFSTVEMSRLFLLRNYLKTLDLRNRWDKLDKYALMGYVKKLIAEEEGQASPVMSEI